ncbi:MAG: DMT family transporter [Rickettsiales bacterium]
MHPIHILFALIIIAIWAGNFVAAKYALEFLPAFLLTGLRFVIVAALIIPFVKPPSKAQLRAILFISVINAMHFALPYAALAMGLSVASTALTMQLGIPFSCLLGAIILKDHLGPWRSLGMAIAFGGMLIIFGEPNVLDHQFAFLITVLGAFLFGWANLMLKRLNDVGAFQLIGWMSLFMIPPNLILSIMFEAHAWPDLTQITALPLMGLVYTAIGASIVGHGLWFVLLQRYPITYVAPYPLLVPVVSAFFALWLFDEPITIELILGGLITLAGVGIIVLRRPKLVELAEKT